MILLVFLCSMVANLLVAIDVSTLLISCVCEIGKREGEGKRVRKGKKEEALKSTKEITKQNQKKRVCFSSFSV